MKSPLHKLLYRTLSLENYLRVVSRLFFAVQRLGWGRRRPSMEYVHALAGIVKRGDVCIDVGANLGYYTRTLARLAGPQGKVYAVEPMPPVLAVLRHNVRRCTNVEILPYALGEADGTIRMANDTVRTAGYFGTGRNVVKEASQGKEAVQGETEHGRAAENGRRQTEKRAAQADNPAMQEYEAEMRRGSELFAECERVDFIKCDVEGYELHVLRDLRPLLERHRPRVLVETGGENRRQVVALFRELGYEGRTLERGRWVTPDPRNEKDILFTRN